MSVERNSISARNFRISLNSSVSIKQIMGVEKTVTTEGAGAAVKVGSFALAC